MLFTIDSLFNSRNEGSVVITKKTGYNNPRNERYGWGLTFCGMFQGCPMFYFFV